MSDGPFDGLDLRQTRVVRAALRRRAAFANGDPPRMFQVQARFKF